MKGNWLTRKISLQESKGDLSSWQRCIKWHWLLLHSGKWICIWLQTDRYWSHSENPLKPITLAAALGIWLYWNVHGRLAGVEEPGNWILPAWLLLMKKFYNFPVPPITPTGVTQEEQNYLRWHCSSWAVAVKGLWGSNWIYTVLIQQHMTGAGGTPSFANLDF